MSNKNSNKGAAKLASVLQSRMSQVVGGNKSISVDIGEILSGKKLKLYSIPNAIFDRDDYSVCATIQSKLPCQKKFPIKEGDKVLVVWTFDGEPVVVDKIVEGSSKEAANELEWQNKCPWCP